MVYLHWLTKRTDYKTLGGIKMNTFFNKVLDVLRQDTRFFSEDGELLRNAVYEAAMQMDAQLIKLLYSNEETQNRFFTDERWTLPDKR